MPRLSKKDEELYEIDKTGCWKWIGGFSWNGYGQMKRNGKHLRAHRYFYEKYKGRLDDKITIDHLCSNRYCVNPSHLEAVSLVENIRRGKRTKLKLSEVKLIRNMYIKGRKQKELSQLFKIDQSEVSRIINGLRWSLT